MVKGFGRVGDVRINNNYNHNLKQDSISGIVNNAEICAKFKYVFETFLVILGQRYGVIKS